MIVTFGFDVGAPPARAQKVFDVRDLSHDVDSPEFVARQMEIVEYAKAHPGENIAIGCAKGKHRSKTMGNRVATRARTGVYHRDYQT